MEKPKILRKVTLTGIDEKTNLDKLEQLTHKYPFVEWGVLLSHDRMGKDPRYPSIEWIKTLQPYVFPLSGHLCGRWVRDFIDDGTAFMDYADIYPVLLDLFQRVQLNISHLLTKLDARKLKQSISKPSVAHWRFIVQVGDSGVPSWFDDMDVDYLHDCSGGRGVTADFLPAANGGNIGYAGGLKPENLEAELARIAAVAQGHLVWIDAESGVRTDQVFDLKKAEDFLAIASEYVSQTPIHKK